MKYLGKTEEMLKVVVKNVIQNIIDGKKNTFVIYTTNKFHEEYIQSRLICIFNEAAINMGHLIISIKKVIDVHVNKYYNGFIINANKDNEQNIRIIDHPMELRGIYADFMYIDINMIDQIDWIYLKSIMKDRNNIFIYEE
jgi:hypothetical protein